MFIIKVNNLSIREVKPIGFGEYFVSYFWPFYNLPPSNPCFYLYRDWQIPVRRTISITIEIFISRGGTQNLKIIPGERAAVASYVCPFLRKDIDLSGRNPDCQAALRVGTGNRAFAALFVSTGTNRIFLFLFMVKPRFKFTAQDRRFPGSPFGLFRETSLNFRGGILLKISSIPFISESSTAADLFSVLARFTAAITFEDSTTLYINSVANISTVCFVGFTLDKVSKRLTLHFLFGLAGIGRSRYGLSLNLKKFKFFSAAAGVRYLIQTIYGITYLTLLRRFFSSISAFFNSFISLPRTTVPWNYKADCEYKTSPGIVVHYLSAIMLINKLRERPSVLSIVPSISILLRAFADSLQRLNMNFIISSTIESHFKGGEDKLVRMHVQKPSVGEWGELPSLTSALLTKNRKVMIFPTLRTKKLPSHSSLDEMIMWVYTYREGAIEVCVCPHLFFICRHFVS